MSLGIVPPICVSGCASLFANAHAHRWLAEDLRIAQTKTVGRDAHRVEYPLSQRLPQGTTAKALHELANDVPARIGVVQLQQSTAEQIRQNLVLEAEVEDLQSRLSIQQSNNQGLDQALLVSQKELDRVKAAAENALQVIEDNRKLEASLSELQEQNSNLSEENAELQDSTQLDWLIRGGGVTLVAFLIGILVTRIRWKKQESWGAY